MRRLGIKKMNNLDYSRLEGIAIGSRKDIRKRIEREETFSTSRERIVRDDILEKVEQAAKKLDFPTTLYFDPQEDFDLCFTLNQYENACVYATTDKEKLEEVTLPRAIGHVQYEEEYTKPVESPQEVFEKQIKVEVPLSYGMYTLLRLRYRVVALFDHPLDFLHEEVTNERKINPNEIKKWRGTINALIHELTERYWPE